MEFARHFSVRTLLGILLGCGVLLAGGSTPATASPPAADHCRVASAVTPARFFDGRVMVPGDRDTHTLEVRNAGDRHSRLRVQIVNGRASGPLSAPFYDEVSLQWPGGRATIGSLVGEPSTPIVDMRLGPGESLVAPLTMTYRTDTAPGSGTRPDLTFGFDIAITLQCADHDQGDLVPPGGESGGTGDGVAPGPPAMEWNLTPTLPETGAEGDLPAADDTHSGGVLFNVIPVDWWPLLVAPVVLAVGRWQARRHTCRVSAKAEVSSR